MIGSSGSWREAIPYRLDLVTAEVWLKRDPEAHGHLELAVDGQTIGEVDLKPSKARLIRILYEAWLRSPHLPATVRGRLKRTQIAELYRALLGNLIPPQDETITRYLTNLQNAFWDAIGFPRKESYPDLVFERGKPWGVQLQIGRVLVHLDEEDRTDPGVR